jgi:hypothetical protein
MQGAPTKEILEEFSITRYRLRGIKLTLAEQEVRVLRTEVSDLRAMNSTLSRQLAQMRDLHNKTRADLLELGKASGVLLEHPMMDALRLFADKAKPESEPIS